MHHTTLGLVGLARSFTRGVVNGQTRWAGLAGGLAVTFSAAALAAGPTDVGCAKPAAATTHAGTGSGLSVNAAKSVAERAARDKGRAAHGAAKATEAGFPSAPDHEREVWRHQGVG
jgi:hypothetical protein